MQASIEVKKGLERQMTVTIEPEKIDLALQQELLNTARNIRMDGFRRGKAPLQLIKRQYANSIQQKAVRHLVEDSFWDMIKSENLKIVTTPDISIDHYVHNKPLTYTAYFEIYPEINLDDFEGITIDLPVLEESEDRVDYIIQQIRRQQATWRPVSRLTQKGDRVTVIYQVTQTNSPEEASLSDEALLKPRTESLILGNNLSWPEFEQALLNREATIPFSVSLPIPEAHFDSNPANKKAPFEITITQIEEPVLPEVNETFLAQFGPAVPEEGVLRTQLKTIADYMIQFTTDCYVKQQLVYQLAQKTDLKVPLSLVREHWKMAQQEATDNLFSEAAMIARQAPDLLIAYAFYKVAENLLFSHIASKHHITLTKEQIKKTIEELSIIYEAPQNIIQHYLEDDSAYKEAKTIALHKQVTETILQKVTARNLLCTFDKLRLLMCDYHLLQAIQKLLLDS